MNDSVGKLLTGFCGPFSTIVVWVVFGWFEGVLAFFLPEIAPRVRTLVRCPDDVRIILAPHAIVDGCQRR